MRLVLLHPKPSVIKRFRKEGKILHKRPSDAQTVASLGDLSRESPAGSCGMQGEMRWLQHALRVTLPPCRRRGRANGR